MSIIYEVNLKVAQSIAAEYLTWLEGHIQDMCQQPGFLSAERFEEIMTDTKSKENSYIVQYKVASIQDLMHYFEHNATAMRQEAIDRFGDQFTASRRVLREI